MANTTPATMKQALFEKKKIELIHEIYSVLAVFEQSLPQSSALERMNYLLKEENDF